MSTTTQYSTGSHFMLTSRTVLNPLQILDLLRTQTTYASYHTQRKTVLLLQQTSSGRRTSASHLRPYLPRDCPTSLSLTPPNVNINKATFKGFTSTKAEVSMCVPHASPVPASSLFQKDGDFLTWVIPADSESPEKGKSRQKTHINQIYLTKLFHR